VDEGALCLSSLGYDPFASRNPDETSYDEDKHKAHTLPCIHPLSLQDESRRFLLLPHSVVKHHQDGGDTSVPTSGFTVFGWKSSIDRMRV
jgi:hypothetical protein